MPNTLHAMRPFTARPVILNAPDKQRATFRSATCNYQYIIRAVAGHDVFGATPDFSHRLDELVTSGRAAPRRADTNNLVGQRLWQEADRLALAHRTDQPAACCLFSPWCTRSGNRHGRCNRRVSPHSRRLRRRNR